MPDTNGYLIAAYTITWVALIGYALRLHRLSRRAAARVAELERASGGSNRE